METIVVGYDRSPAAASALDWVANRATREGARVELILVTNMFLSDEIAAQDVLSHGEETLKARIPGLPVEITRADGLMPGTLVTLARGADLLVVGADEGHSARTALRGFLPQRVSARASTPTCIVPRGWTATDGPVVVGLADDPSSDTALEFAAVEAEATAQDLRIVHAWHRALPPDQLASPPMTLEEINRQHRAFADGAAGRVRRNHAALSIHIELTPADPGLALATAADDASLLVIGTHRHGLVASSLAGSVGLDLIGKVHAPICVVPASQSTPAELDEIEMTEEEA